MNLRHTARRIRRDDEGVTLVEMMVGIFGATMIIAAGYMMMTQATKMQVRTTDRIDATARGRVAMDRITRDIRSQQCLDSATPAMQWAYDTGMQFYAAVAGDTAGVQPIERRRLEWKKQGQIDGVDVGDITETVWRSSTTTVPYVFPATPTRVAVIADDVEQDGATPIFRYYGYDTGKVGRPSPTPFPMVVQATSTINPVGKGVATESLARIVLVEIRYLAQPRADHSVRSSSTKSQSVPFFNRVAVRTADPSDPLRSPLCL